MKIKYCDLIAYSGLHTEFNSACLQMLMIAFDSNDVDFYAEKEHCQICQKKISKSAIKFHPFKLLDKRLIGGFKTLFRDVISCFYVIKLFLFSKKDDVLFFALAYPVAQYMIYLLSNILVRNVYLCQHGELEVFVNPSLFTRNKKYYSLIKPLLRTKKIKQVILGEPIWENAKHLFGSQSQIILIDHPCDFKIKNNDNINKTLNPLVIGQIGSGNAEKGTPYLFELSELLSNEIRNGLLKIKLLGRLDADLNPLDNQLVEYSQILLTSDKFEQEIRSIHYSLQLRDNTMGKTVASGTFLDTMKYEKPFIALRSDYINYYIEEFSRCGKICDSVFEIAEEVKRILQIDKNERMSEYELSKHDIRQFKDAFSLEAIAAKFKAQL